MSTKNMVLNRALRAKNANAAFAETLKAVRNSGHLVASDDSASIGSGRSTTEIINFSMEVESPRDRLILNPQRPTNIVTSVARFVWMMSGNNRLEDIAFYEPKVGKFTDDHLTVPGSDYGMRMFQPRPGLDQISGIVNELRKHKQSRRATVAVFHPEDAVRQGSADIPCTFGLNFLIRDGKLYSTTIMRSNNAMQLLPFNLFEFSMLAEVIAVESGVELGPMTHLALSMHVYENDIDGVDAIVEGARKVPASLMEAMPGDPLKKINHLAQMEARLRHKSGALSDANVEEWIAESEDPKLGPYWSQFYLVLLSHIADKTDTSVSRAVRSAIKAPFLGLLRKKPTAKPSMAPSAASLDLFGAGPTVINMLETKRMRSLKARLEEHESASGTPLPVAQVWKLQSHFSERIAARFDAPEISIEEFQTALNSVRGSAD